MSLFFPLASFGFGSIVKYSSSHSGFSHQYGYSSKSSSLLNVCAGHSTSLISWMKHQPEDENYDFITNDLDMVLERLSELESTSNLNLKDKYKVHFLYDVSRYYIMHYISGRSFMLTRVYPVLNLGKKVGHPCLITLQRQNHQSK